MAPSLVFSKRFKRLGALDCKVYLPRLKAFSFRFNRPRYLHKTTRGFSRIPHHRYRYILLSSHPSHATSTFNGTLRNDRAAGYHELFAIIYWCIAAVIYFTTPAIWSSNPFAWLFSCRFPASIVRSLLPPSHPLDFFSPHRQIKRRHSRRWQQRSQR